MQEGFQSKIKNGMANSVDTDEMAHYEPFHQDLHCLHRYLFWSARLKGLNSTFYGYFRFYFKALMSQTF